MKSNRFNVCRWTVIAAALLLVSSLVFTGCKTDDDDDDVLPYTGLSYSIKNKKWEDDFSGWNTYVTYDFCVTNSYIETSSYGRQEGEIHIVKTSATSGIIYYEITNTTNFSYSSKTAESYLGTWYGVFYDELTPNSVKICDACPADYTTDYHTFASYEDAVANLTKEVYYSNAPYFTVVK